MKMDRNGRDASVRARERKLRRWLGEGLNAAVHLTVYGGCLALFFCFMSINNWPLRGLSRTTGTTLLTWCAMGAAMLAVYGRLQLGRRRRRQMICGQALGCFVTDAVTYLQLQIMNVNPNNNDRLILFGEDLPWLVACMALQLLLILAAVCVFSAVYVHLNPPRRTLLVVGEAATAPLYLRKLAQEEQIWRVDRVCTCTDGGLEEALEAVETVVLGAGIPDGVRQMLLRRCYEAGQEVLCRAGLEEILTMSARPVIVDDAPYLSLQRRRMTPLQRVVKRGMDIVISLVMLILLSPVMALVALAIHLRDGAPVLFHQQRLTADGHPFTMTKFRTMRSGGGQEISATARDGRITPTGAFLRRWRLDELPQLFNILRGDMSLVGPRPEMLENVARYKAVLPDFVYRERMKAGLTGLAQIEGRYNTDPQDKLMMDLMYIEGFSLWEDVKLLLRTLTVFFRPDSTEGFPEHGEDKPEGG